MNLAKFNNFWDEFKYTKAFRTPMWIYNRLKYRNLDQKKYYQVQMRLGHKIKVRPTVPYLRNVILNRQYNDDNVFLISKFVPNNGVVIDIGANIGLCSCAYAQFLKNKNVKIFAVEAIQRNYNLLVENIKLNNLSSIKPFRLAFGDKQGELSFLLPSEDFEGNAVSKEMMNESDIKKTESQHHYIEVVPMDTMENWSQEQGIKRCDFIKIDIEGAELLVLKASETFLRKTRPVILSEYNKYWMDNKNIKIEDIKLFFEGLNYRVLVEKGNTFVDLDLSIFNEELIDLLYVPQEKLAK